LPSITEALIWDLDGTLVDSPRAVQSATNAALADVGFGPVDLDAVQRGMVRPTIPRMCAHAGIPESDPRGQQLNDRFYMHVLLTFPGQARLFPGMLSVLETLYERGVPMGVVTNNLGRLARLTLAENGVAHLFAAILGDGDTPDHKPDPRGAWMAAAACGVDPARCSYIGDSAVDRDTAQAAGMRAVGVSWGTTPRAGLTGFALVCDHPSEILRLSA
jgi:phosphoglycolate phosphatase